MKKIILLDLDGTIINYGCKIDDEMVRYILSVKKKDMKSEWLVKEDWKE